MPGVGGSSLLVIFAVLCLTVFALLGLSEVQMYRRLSEANAQVICDYYAADSRAEEMFAQLRGGQLPEGVRQEGERYYYAVPLSDTQELRVCVAEQGEHWDVLQWQLVATVEAAEEATRSLWDGETF